MQLLRQAESQKKKKMSLNLHRLALAVPSDLCAALGGSSHLGIQTEADPEHPPRADVSSRPGQTNP